MSDGFVGLRRFLLERDDRLRNSQVRAKAIRLYGTLYNFLRERKDDPDYAAIIDFVGTHAASQHAIGPEDNFLGLKLERKLHSLRSASIEYNFDVKRLRKMLIDSGAIPAETKALLDMHVSLDVETVAALIMKDRARAPKDYVMKKLGITASIVDAFADAGFLRCYRSDSLLPVYSREDVESILARLIAKAGNEILPGMITLHDSRRRSRRPFTELLKFALDGTFSKLAFDPRIATKNILSLYVDTSELYASNETTDYGVPAVSKILRTDCETVSRLVADGILKSYKAKSPRTGSIQRFFTADAVEEFQRDYVLLSRYAAGRGNLGMVNKRLKSMEIIPIVDGITGKGKKRYSTVYRRSDLPD
jgi:hypothetical protein